MNVGHMEPSSPAGGSPPPGQWGAEGWSLRLPALPENVALVREAVRREAERMGMGPREVEDLRTVVSEACNNVVLHAYPAGTENRPLEIGLRRDGEDLELLVRDRGQGIHAGSDTTPQSLRLGLTLIGSLAASFQIRSGRGRGTELLIKIPLAAA
jgi:anti-sigma regulatory factor (Ser/Thr protein kinase)